MNKNLILSRVIILILVASTTGIAGIVAAKTMPKIQEKNAIETTKTETQTILEKAEEIISTITPTITKLITKSPTKTPTTNPTPFPTAVVSPKVTAGGNCVVTLFGQQYDVTFLKSSHSGGDIFRCGTDMTTSYQDKHGSNLSRMQNYLIGSNGTAPNPQAVNQNKEDEREEDDD